MVAPITTFVAFVEFEPNSYPFPGQRYSREFVQEKDAVEFFESVIAMPECISAGVERISFLPDDKYETAFVIQFLADGRILSAA